MAMILILFNCTDSSSGGGDSSADDKDSNSDTTAPSYATVTIDNGSSVSFSSEVTLSLSAADDVGVTGYLVSESSITPMTDDSAWVLVNSSTSFSLAIAFTFSSGNDEKIVYVFYKDEAGNISSAASDSITITRWTDSEVGGKAITTAESGSIYIVGEGSLGGGMVLTKLDYSGATIWTRTLQSTINTWVDGVAVDESENIYVVGSVTGEFDGHANLGSSDIYLVKFNSEGDKQWSLQTGTADADKTTVHGSNGGVGIDSEGKIYIAGSTYGNFDGVSSGTEDIFVMKLDDASGDVIWINQKDDSDFDWLHDMIVDSEGNTYVTGAGNLDGHYTCNTGLADTITLKYSTSGDILWTAQIGHCNASKGMAVRIDSSKNVYVAAYTRLSIDGNPFYGGSNDFFIMKYDSLGNKQWTEQFGTDASDIPMALIVDSSSNSYVVGATSGTFEGNLTSEEGGAYVVKYDSSGNRLWNDQFSAGGVDAAMDNWGGIIILGSSSLIRINSSGARSDPSSAVD
jgi:beta-propeller repeat-containing protein